MSIRTSALAGKPSSSPLDHITRTPLSIRSLRPRSKPMRPAIDRVRDEFAEMRGFSPTLAQAARLFDLSFEECDRLLRSLVQEGSLTKGVDGRYRLA